MDCSDTRRRCKEEFTKVFSQQMEGTDSERASTLGDLLEEEIHRTTSTRAEYGMLFRTKYLNLKDASHKWLCTSVYNGVLAIEKFIAMTGDEMRSKELKELEAKIFQRALLDTTIAQQEAETDIFFCTKCKQRKCTYRQLQTRSADEPMTTYVHCVVCKNNWKFC
ncbi:transcription elongation factor S-II [Nematocida parisii]|uniref:Transcription elongation factor A n=1 Tax=Nematocida parisii (strain ERTm3) TaxID=935791 RepID=I3EGW9_NEMP3|nr:transcription elongation factor A [Nematocida parisii ERTm1]EIJ88466.1 transcription elongation factor A [Nematocida parisii ERTm3]KAI5130719.1 transcription elongation factor S-II [Nematocida parisii]EIJ94719.1 transcription elongation factor A [Nematocida parisii ERTm1]KAI5130773.1 transcription elongation factor S-II [Nematocida parisii]KAI5144654.1 transcription elongation factor S-II [Nematocida parisii]|eukprot:XP_013058075.1 transcription elongation factor A [Nematocida parisii ERTm1]